MRIAGLATAPAGTGRTMARAPQPLDPGRALEGATEAV